MGLLFCAVGFRDVFTCFGAVAFSALGLLSVLEFSVLRGRVSGIRFPVYRLMGLLRFMGLWGIRGLGIADFTWV